MNSNDNTNIGTRIISPGTHDEFNLVYIRFGGKIKKIKNRITNGIAAVRSLFDFFFYVEID